MFSHRKSSSCVSDCLVCVCVCGCVCFIYGCCCLSILADALTRSESYRAEVELDLSKERSDNGMLRDLLSKIQTLNEGLTQDKIELNKIIFLVRTFAVEFIMSIIYRMCYIRV
jgi:hypothetical protein